MSQLTLDQALQFIALLLALVEVIVGLYILVLNHRHTANRHVGIFLLLSAANTYAVGMMIGSQTAAQAEHSAIILAMTTSATEPLLLVTSVSLLRPQWLEGRLRWIWLPVYGLALLPAILTGMDLFFGTRTWFTGIDAATYPGGFLISPEFTDGSLSAIIRIGFILCFVIIISLLIYIAQFDTQSTPKEKKLAWILFLQQFITGALLTYFAQILLPSVTVLLTNTIFVVTYASIAFEQLISERSKQSGSIQSRLIAVILIVSIPAMVASTMLIVNHAQRMLIESNNRNLSTVTRHLLSSTQQWLSTNQNLLEQLSSQAEINSKDVAKQQIILEDTIRSYPHISFASILDERGKVLASSARTQIGTQVDLGQLLEAGSLPSYGFHTILRDQNNTPILASLKRIDSADGLHLGYILLATSPEILGEQVGVGPLGIQGATYILDSLDQMITSSDTNQIPESPSLKDYPPVVLLHQGYLGPVDFIDSQGQSWRAKSGLLSNGWAVIAQIPTTELDAPVMFLSRMAWVTLVTAVVILGTLSILMVRQSIRPVKTLTEVAGAVAAGDLTQVAPIESEDEIGLLARSFNSMTNQVRELVGSLEERVQQRTQELESRAIQLQVAAEVAQEAASIHELNQLLTHTVHRISDRFNFYHAGIFLIDSSKEYAVLVAASSEGGQRMLARGHKLRIGQVGIVGFVAARGEPRIALDVGKDAMYFDNPDLPLTRSELALPMKARAQVIGVLDVQSVKPAAFTDEDSAILQILADQIALAIENARLLKSSNDSLRELETLYRQQVEQAWEQQLANTHIAYSYNRLGIKSLPLDHELKIDSFREDSACSSHSLEIPIRLRNTTLGILELRREPDDHPWTEDDLEIIDATVTQVALALESSRLKEIERKRIQKDQIISQISAKTQSALDLDTVMRRAVLEIGQALKAEKVQIELKSNPQANPVSGNGAHE